MSADNILVILHHKGKVRVYDTNFSWVSSRPAWNFPLTAENSQELTKEIVNSRFEREIHKCNTTAEAESFCRRYRRMPNVIVEYGEANIIVWPDGTNTVTKPKPKKRHHVSSV